MVEEIKERTREDLINEKKEELAREIAEYKEELKARLTEKM